MDIKKYKILAYQTMEKVIEVRGLKKFYGKNEPYTVAFDNQKNDADARFLDDRQTDKFDRHAQSSLSVEIVTSESYLLKTMRSYLDNTGESVLQKLVYSLQSDSLIKLK